MYNISVTFNLALIQMGCIVSESSIVIPLSKPFSSDVPTYQSQNQHQIQNQNKQSHNQAWSPQYQQPYQTQPNYSNNAYPQGQPVWQNQQQPYTVNPNYQQKKVYNPNPVNNSQSSNFQNAQVNGQNMTQKPLQTPKNTESNVTVQRNDKKQKTKNPSNPNLLNTDQILQSPSLPDYNEFLVQLQKFINSTPQLTALLSKDFFSSLFTQYSTQYWSTDSKQQFITILLNYIKFTSSQISQSQKNETKYQLKTFAEIFGRDMYKIFNSVKMKNFWVLQTLSYEEKYKGKKFSLSNSQQILKLVNQVKYLCANNTQALVYLSHYLMKCCNQLQKQKTSPQKINQILKKQVVILKQMFSPKHTLEEQLKQNNRSIEKDQLSKIPSMDIPYKKKTFVFKTQNKQQQLNDFIMEIVELGKKHYSTFTNLTSHCCLENQGFGYKSNLKLNQRSQTMQLLRVKQKLLGNFINQYYKNKTYNCKSIADLRTAEIAYLEESLKNVYSKMDQVQFIVTDILRGKCMFNKVSHINAAAQLIMKTVEERSSKGQNIQVVSIDNRLMKITADLMLRIRIDEIVCEFQIALKFNQAQNQIHHKMYQVERSKVFSPVTMLFNWHQSLSNEFFGNFESVFQKYNKDQKQQINIAATNLKKIMQYKAYGHKSTGGGRISKKNLDYLNRIKSQIKNMKNPPDLSKNMYMRTGICLKQMKKYNEATNALFKHKQKQPRDVDVLSEIGSVYHKQAQYRKAHQYLSEYFNITDKLPEESADINRYHKAIIDYAQANFQIGKNNLILQFLKICLPEFEAKYFGDKSKQYAKILCLTARGNVRVGKLKQAQNLYLQAIELFQKAEGEHEDPNYPQAFRLLAQFYIHNVNNPSKALQYLSKAFSLTEGMFGKESIESATVLMTMGNAYDKLGKFEEAQNYLNKYAFITENLLTKESMEYATAYFHFSGLYLRMKRYEQALILMLKCKQLMDSLTGRESRQFSQILNMIGIIYQSMENDQEALKQFLQALQIFTALCEQEGSRFTNQMAVMYQNIAFCYKRLDDSQSYLQYLEKRRQALEVIFGPQSLQIAQCLDTITNQLIQLNRNQQALQYLEIAIIIYEKKQIDSQAYFTDLQYKALCLCKVGQVKQSMELYIKLTEIRKKKQGQNSIKYADLLIQMYKCFENLWGIAQKKQILGQVLKIYESNKHPQTQNIKFLLQNLQNQHNNGGYGQNQEQEEGQDEGDGQDEEDGQ